MLAYSCMHSFSPNACLPREFVKLCMGKVKEGNQSKILAVPSVRQTGIEANCMGKRGLKSCKILIVHFTNLPLALLYCALVQRVCA